jgi:hypothetical protein
MYGTLRTVRAPADVASEVVPLVVRLVSVPTLVSDDATTGLFSVVPLSVDASATAVIVMSALPLNATPLMLREVCSVVAVLALPVTAPVTLPDIPPVAVISPVTPSVPGMVTFPLATGR